MAYYIILAVTGAVSYSIIGEAAYSIIGGVAYIIIGEVAYCVLGAIAMYSYEDYTEEPKIKDVFNTENRVYFL